MRRVDVDVIGHLDIKPQDGDVVLNLECPGHLYFVTGRGDLDGNNKDTCFTINGGFINGVYKNLGGWSDDEFFKIIIRNGKPFEYPETPGYSTEIDGVKYKLVKENNDE